jgi:hypothetical protein
MERLCYDCLDERMGLEPARRTTYGEKCDGCRRLEIQNPVGAAASDHVWSPEEVVGFLG